MKTATKYELLGEMPALICQECAYRTPPSETAELASFDDRRAFWCLCGNPLDTISSIFLDTREWFDKTGGSHYFSSRVYFDGELETTFSFQYGYEEMDKQRLREYLEEIGLINGANVSTLYELRNAGVHVYTAKKPALLREVKNWGIR